MLCQQLDPTPCAIFAKLKGEASNRDVLSFHMGTYVYLQLAQYNPMLAYVYPSRLHNACTTTRPKCARGDDCGLSGGRFAQQETIASVGHLAARISSHFHTGALC